MAGVPPRKYLRWFALAILFLAFFGLPVLLAGLFGGIPFFGGKKSSASSELFPNAFPVSSQGSFLRIAHAEDIVPREGKDLIVITWFRVKKFPDLGQRLILLSKYQGSPLPSEGYAIGLTREPQGIRPTVFWGDSKTKGKWFEFSETAIVPKEWFALILSFHGDRYLGLHIVRIIGSGIGDSELLGGYDLGDGAGMEMGQADLLLGAPGERPFRGSIGPVAILSKKDLASQIKELVKAVQKKPLNFIDGLESREVRVWLPSGERDLSEYGHILELVNPRKKSAVAKTMAQVQSSSSASSKGNDQVTTGVVAKGGASVVKSTSVATQKKSVKKPSKPGKAIPNKKVQKDSKKAKGPAPVKSKKSMAAKN